MKKLLTFITMLFMTVCMATPSHAEETSPRRLDVQLVQVSLRDSGNQVHQNNLYDGSSFFLNLTWNSTETVHTGDYFDILVPESIDMSSDKLDRTFPIIDSATGDNIGEGTLYPNGTEGGKISVVFNEQVNNRSNLSGNVYLWVPFNKNHITLNQKNVFTFTIKGNGIYNGYQMSAETTITRPSTDGEVIAKWGQGLPDEPNTVKWIIRVNKSGMDLHHVILSDSLVTDNGWFLHPVDISKERFKLQKVTYTENAGISNWGEVIDVTDKIQFAPDYKSWTLDLGDIGTQGYMLFMKTAMTSGTLQKNKIAISSDEVTKDVTAQYKLADVGGDTGVTTKGKLQIVKQDSETGAGLAGAKFEIKDLDDNTTQTLVTGADGTAVTPNVVFEANYEVKEIEAPFGYKLNNTVYTIQTSVSKDNIVTVKDEPITRYIKVSKTWVGNTGTQAVMHLYADNVDTGKSVTLDTSNNWEYTFVNLRKYNGNQEIQYSIKEDEMNFYMTSITGDMDNGFNVTNTWNEQHELPGDAPTVEIPEFKITTFVNTNNEQIADFENGFTDKKDEITFNGNKYVFKEKLPDQDGIRTYVYEEFHSEIPNDSPTVEVPELKVTRFVDEQGNDLHELEENFVEKLDINGYVFKETTETSDIRTHVYTKVETEIPNDSPTVEVPELKITRFIDTNGVELKNIVEGFVEKDSNIVYENEQYDYVNTTEENGIRTHVYKKHVNEEVPNNNTTTPTDNDTTTENNVIVEHTAPTGDNMNNTLKLFALSMLGLGFVLFKRKDLSNE
jgi:collagen-binding protein A